MSSKQIKMDFFLKSNKNIIVDNCFLKNSCKRKISALDYNSFKLKVKKIDHYLKDDLESKQRIDNTFTETYNPFFINTNRLCKTGTSIVNSLTDIEWKKILCNEIVKPYMCSLFIFLEKEYLKNKEIFPPRNLIFNALNLTSFSNIRLVLIGQDPYHDNDQAHGLCFSVPKGIKPPPSLKNIFKELKNEYPDFNVPTHGCLVPWTAQGIFLLNTTLTVEAHKANSHSQIGWQKFTDSIIKFISIHSKKPVIFLLWGAFAHKKENLIDLKKHKIIKAAHPSPLSYHKFKGSNCFTQVNKHLLELNIEPINWNCLI